MSWILRHELCIIAHYNETKSSCINIQLVAYRVYAIIIELHGLNHYKISSYAKLVILLFLFMLMFYLDLFILLELAASVSYVYLIDVNAQRCFGKQQRAKQRST